MKYGIIIRNVTDLRRRPNPFSERKSQLLYNEPITITSARTDYYHVFQNDKYDGWIDQRAVFLMPQRRLKEYISRLNYIIQSATLRINKKSRPPGICPPFLFYGTRLHVSAVRRGSARIELSDQTTTTASSRSISALDVKYKSPLLWRRFIVKSALKFLGVPYLWGGTTPFGCDCSGLVKMVYRNAGIYLPRDSKDQRRFGSRIDPDNLTAADLLFFKGHVAIAVNKKIFIHSSLAEGGTALNSIHVNQPLYRKDLAKTFIEARRLIS